MTSAPCTWRVFNKNSKMAAKVPTKAARKGSPKRRQQWETTSMIDAIDGVKASGKGLRQAAREYGVAVASLKWSI